MTEIPIGSKWKHKNSNDVYVVMEQYSHRVVLKHELTGTTIKLTLGHLNPDGFADYERIEKMKLNTIVLLNAYQTIILCWGIAYILGIFK